MTFETFDQSYEETWPDQQKDNEKEEHPQRTFLDTCDLWDNDTFLTIENNTLNIHSDPWIKSDRDSIRNSCDVFQKAFCFAAVVWQI